MSAIKHVRFYPSDWLAGTRGLTAAETGVYITLIALMYENCGPVQNDTARLARLCGTSSSAFSKIIKSLIGDGKISETQDGLFNARVEREIEFVVEKSELARNNIKTRWDKNLNKSKSDSYGRNTDELLTSSYKLVISSLHSDSAPAPQPNSDLNSEIQIKPEPIAKPKTTKPPKPVKTALDPNASPAADDRTYAANLGMTEATLANEWEKFKLNHLSRQTRAVSWAMTWQTWVRNWVSYGARNIGDKPWATASPKPSFTEIRPAGLEAVPVHETEEEANRWWHNRMMGTAQ